MFFLIISKPFNFSIKSLFTIFQLLYTFIKSPEIPGKEILFHSIHFKVSKNFADLSNIIFQFTTFSIRKFLWFEWFNNWWIYVFLTLVFPIREEMEATFGKYSFLLFSLVDPVIIWLRRGGEPLCRMWQLWRRVIN